MFTKEEVTAYEAGYKIGLLNGKMSSVPKGEWIDREQRDGKFYLWKYECNACGGRSMTDSPFCPNCGARMESE